MSSQTMPASDRNGSNRKCTKLHRNSNRLKIHTSKARKSRARAITAAVTDLTGPQTSLNWLRKPVELGKGRVQPPRALCWHSLNLTLCQEARNRQRSVFLPTQTTQHSTEETSLFSSPAMAHRPICTAVQWKLSQHCCYLRKVPSSTATLCQGAQPWDPPVGASQGTGSRTAVSAQAVPGLALSRGGEVISSGRLPRFWSLRALHGNAASCMDVPTSLSLSPCAAAPAPKACEGVGRVPQ